MNPSDSDLSPHMLDRFDLCAYSDFPNDDTDGRRAILSSKERYIDEARYARFYIHDKSRFDKWGRNKIAQGLKLKKVPSAVYAGLLDELDEEEYLDGLRTLLAAKRKHVKARTDYERNGKLIRFALGRGYEMDAIRRCLPEADDDEFMD